jgi:hypothetical protein
MVSVIAAVFVGCVMPAMGATAEGPDTSAAATSATVGRRSPYRPPSLTPGAASYYASTLGVTGLRVQRTNAGNLIRFGYRVADPAKAKGITDREAKPVLIGHTSHAMLQVPVMDNVGPLRQATRQEAGKEYWIVFSNKGDLVKSGERVSVFVGSFRIDGLRVD